MPPTMTMTEEDRPASNQAPGASAPTAIAAERAQAILDGTAAPAAATGGWVMRRRTTSPLETRFITR